MDTRFDTNSRLVTDTDMEEIISPYLKKRFEGPQKRIIPILLVSSIFFVLIGIFTNTSIDIILKTVIVCACVLLFFALYFKICAALMIRRISKGESYIKKVEYVDWERGINAKNNVALVLMKVKEYDEHGKASIQKYECLTNDVKDKVYGNSINRRLRKGDVVYKITDKDDKVILLIGDGKGDLPVQKSLFVRLIAGFIASFIFAFKSAFVIGLLIVFFQTLISLVVNLFNGDLFSGFTWYSYIGGLSEVYSVGEFFLAPGVMAGCLFLVLFMLSCFGVFGRRE